MPNTIAVIVPREVDHLECLARAQARMRSAETAAALDRAIGAMDVACTGILRAPVRTRADLSLRVRAQEWVDTRTRQVATAHQTLTARSLYRVRRVAAEKPYARKEAIAARKGGAM